MNISFPCISYPCALINRVGFNFLFSYVKFKRYPCHFQEFSKSVSKISFQSSGLETKQLEKLYIEEFTYFCLDAPPNFRPLEYFSDISGYISYYHDGPSGLHFSDVSEYSLIRAVPLELLHEYHSIRSQIQ